MKQLIRNIHFKLNTNHYREYLKSISGYDQMNNKEWRAQVKSHLLHQLKAHLMDTIGDYESKIQGIPSMTKLLESFDKSKNLPTTAEYEGYLSTENYSILEKTGTERVSERWEILSSDGELLESTPFPLLNSVDGMKLTKGPMDTILGDYGLEVRDKTQKEMLFLWINRKESNKSLNKYLKSQYTQLLNYREKNDIESYWKKYYFLLQQSDAFFLANLSNWNELWYKNMDILQVMNLRKEIRSFGTNTGLDLEELRNV